jgi:DNA-binding response OmpR family regulator
MANPCILIVESDLVVRHPLAEYLRECGYRVLEAADTDEAQTVLSEDDITVDFVLCDVRGPGSIDGFGLAHWLRQHAVSTEIILAGTLSKAAEKASDLCEEGPRLSKPYDHKILLDRIKQMTAARDRNRVKGSNTE